MDNEQINQIKAQIASQQIAGVESRSTKGLTDRLYGNESGPVPQSAMSSLAERTAGLVNEVRAFNNQLAALLERLGLPELQNSKDGRPVGEPYGAIALVNSNIDELSDAVYRSVALIQRLQELV